MIRICFDTEFTGLGLGPFGIGPQLISIGLISVDDVNRTFYAELTDTYTLDDCENFVIQEVLPLLQGGDSRMTLDELTVRLKEWIEAFGEPIVLLTDSLNYDWRWLQEIFREPGSWPVNLDGHPVLLNFNHLLDAERFADAVERAFASGQYRRHHAADDARVNRLGWIAAGGDNLDDQHGIPSTESGIDALSRDGLKPPL